MKLPYNSERRLAQKKELKLGIYMVDAARRSN
jgi:hypothetical protein